MLNRSRNLAFNANLREGTRVDWKNPLRVFFDYAAELRQTALGFSNGRVYFCVVALDAM